MIKRKTLPPRATFNAAAGDSWSDDQGLIDYDTWERRVFLAASQYSVVVTLGRGQINTKWFKTYPEAMVAAINTPRGLLYVSTSSGRAVCIQRKDFEKYLELYNEVTGQRLRLSDDLRNKLERPQWKA